MPTSPVKTRIPVTSFGHLITEVKRQFLKIDAPTPAELTGWRKHFNSYTIQGRRNGFISIGNQLSVEVWMHLENRAVQGCTESIVYALGQWGNVMSGSQSRMVQHNDTDLTAEPEGPSKTAELPVPCPIVPTHFRPFRHQRDCDLITQTMHYLSQSGFYWGPFEVDEAHTQLAKLPLGTFLLRDSMQTNVFFTLSYQAPEGPTSVRVLLKDGEFSLAGSKHTFTCLFGLLAYYIASPKKSLSRPYRGNAPQGLQELARRAVMNSCRKENIHQLPLSRKLQDFLSSYPFSI